MKRGEIPRFPFKASAKDEETASRTADLLDRSEAAGRPLFTKFLDEREAMAARFVLESRRHTGYKFFGGREGCERAVLALWPERTPPPGDFPISALRVIGSGYRSLTHRDWLGSIMAAGIKRELVGDIAVESDSSAVVFVYSDIARFLIENLTSAGSDKVKAELIPAGNLAFAPSREPLRVGATVASLRLDAVAGASMKTSREKAKAAVKRELVSVNHAPAPDPDQQLAEGDLITIRGYGRFRLAEIGGTTRKGNLKITLECPK